MPSPHVILDRKHCDIRIASHYNNKCQMRLRKLSAWILYRWHGPKWHQRIRQGCQLPPSYKLFTWIFIESYSHDSIFSRDWILEEDDRQLRLETLTVVNCCDEHYELAFYKNIKHSFRTLMTDLVGYPKTRKGKNPTLGYPTQSPQPEPDFCYRTT